MADIFKDVPLLEFRGGKDFKKVDPKDVLKGKVVCVYFSAHWCGPCRQFTPVLKEFYEALKGEPIEVIFATRDHSEEEMFEYMREAHGRWHAIPYNDPHIAQLKEKLDVNGIPTLVVLAPNGTVIDDDAVGAVDNSSDRPPKEVFAEWKKSAGL